MNTAAEIYERLKAPRKKINDAADDNFLYMFAAGFIGLLVPVCFKGFHKLKELPMILSMVGGYLAGSRIAGAINCKISMNKADKLYEESLGEYKDHALAKYAYNKYQRPSALYGMVNDLHVASVNNSFDWYVKK